jgi:predicted nucleotidyltransferase
MHPGILQTAELQSLLKAFKERHAQEYHLLALGYFGSYARNEATPESDIDVVFETDQPNLFRTVRLKQELEALLGRPVDVLHLRGLSNPRLRARVENEAICV